MLKAFLVFKQGVCQRKATNGKDNRSGYVAKGFCIKPFVNKVKAFQAKSGKGGKCAKNTSADQCFKGWADVWVLALPCHKSA